MVLLVTGYVVDALRCQLVKLVARMISVASLLYASPAWWGFMEDFSLLHRTGSFFWCWPLQVNQLQSRPCSTTLSITDKKPSGHNLHPRAHGFALPIKDSRNFVSHTLYGVFVKDCWNHFINVRLMLFYLEINCVSTTAVIYYVSPNKRRRFYSILTAFVNTKSCIVSTF